MSHEGTSSNAVHYLYQLLNAKSSRPDIDYAIDELQHQLKELSGICICNLQMGLRSWNGRFLVMRNMWNRRALFTAAKLLKHGFKRINTSRCTVNGWGGILMSDTISDLSQMVADELKFCPRIQTLAMAMLGLERMWQMFLDWTDKETAPCFSP